MPAMASRPSLEATAWARRSELLQHVGAQRTQDASAVDSGRRHVEHDQVEIASPRQTVAVQSVACQVCTEACLAQALAQVVRSLDFVLNHQQLS